MFVMTRFRVEAAQTEQFRSEAYDALAALAARPGYVEGRLGRNLDDPELWAVTTTWADVGSYRRALSSYDVKVSAVPLLARALDEPTAYETVPPGGVPNEPRARELG
jgi:quinol monooxygenase YgiN